MRTFYHDPTSRHNTLQPSSACDCSYYRSQCHTFVSATRTSRSRSPFPVANQHSNGQHFFTWQTQYFLYLSCFPWQSWKASRPIIVNLFRHLGLPSSSPHDRPPAYPPRSFNHTRCLCEGINSDSQCPHCALWSSESDCLSDICYPHFVARRGPNYFKTSTDHGSHFILRT